MMKIKKINFILTFTLLISLAKISFAQRLDNQLTANKVDPSRFREIASIQVLNKTNAKAQIIDLEVGQEISLKNLLITAHKCWQSPLDQKPESKILLEVVEKSLENNDKKERLFFGWLFASSPSISGLEHPIYDIIAINCKENDTTN